MIDLPQRVDALFAELIDQDRERGLQAAAYHRGELILDACAGFTDGTRAVPVTPRTLFPVFSVSKGIGATVIHRLAERGLLDYDERIATYWPEFGCKGKEAITLRQALAHSAGLPHMPPNLRIEDLADWQKMCAAFVDMKPLTEPGSEVAYHAISYSWLIGEPACRVTGKSFPQLVEEEIREPLHEPDLFIGMPRGETALVATLEEVGPEQTFPPSDEPSAIPWWTQPLYQFMNHPEMRYSCLPASSGVMSARAVAKHYATFAPEGVEGIRLMSAERQAQATAIQSTTNGVPTRRCLGYIIWNELDDRGRRTGSIGHGGFGGSDGFYDPKADIAFAFTRNRTRDPHDPPTGKLVADLVYEAVGA